ncbi:peptidoglycan-associated lipoprotein Pal [Chitinilyticum piscinae]|uniref:Peptidoglycan-associated lipoprotein n=1 Tax=Chitinilyticum piscinae TaxID=2866724 RepID=A0A8J7FYT4_9NEIS|nr:peptidoglycan-associated lipoprotein Pal [Chitinilyticum piscinae]MBE9608183.1 peptidoglycan-associated lipoprotein Pal [Chitinilyticum piscinae]
MKKIGLSLILTALLAACASNTAPVTDKNAGANGGSQTDGATVKPVDVSGTSGKGYSPLTDPNNILSTRRVYFDYDSYVVSAEYNEVIQAHAKYLMGNKDAKVILQGNTDNRGTAEYNLALGQKRADAVKKMMNALGVQDAQIESVSFGEEKPIELGDTDEAWARNRRAEIVYQGEMPK